MRSCPTHWIISATKPAVDPVQGLDHTAPPGPRLEECGQVVGLLSRASQAALALFVMALLDVLNAVDARAEEERRSPFNKSAWVESRAEYRCHTRGTTSGSVAHGDVGYVLQQGKKKADVSLRTKIKRRRWVSVQPLFLRGKENRI